jgi:predicted aspartyl protease
MSIQHRYDRSGVPSLRLEVHVSHPIAGEQIPELAAVDTGASITKIPIGLKESLGELKKMGSRTIKYGNKKEETHTTYLAKIHFDGFHLDAVVYFREADFILLGRNVLNQVKMTADGRNLLFWFQ